jgi:hypothetical protein
MSENIPPTQQQQAVELSRIGKPATINYDISYNMEVNRPVSRAMG